MNDTAKSSKACFTIADPKWEERFQVIPYKLKKGWPENNSSSPSLPAASLYHPSFWKGWGFSSTPVILCSKDCLYDFVTPSNGWTQKVEDKLPKVTYILSDEGGTTIVRKVSKGDDATTEFLKSLTFTVRSKTQGAKSFTVKLTGRGSVSRVASGCLSSEWRLLEGFECDRVGTN